MNLSCNRLASFIALIKMLASMKVSFYSLLYGMAILPATSLSAETSEKVAAEIMKSTLRVVSFDRDNNMEFGTGFVISTNGHVATNRHVIENGITHCVVYSDGDHVKIRKATIVVISPTADLAILQCDPIPGTTVVLLSSADLVAGQTVSAVGFPGAIDTTQSWATLVGVEMTEIPGDGTITNADAKSDFQPAVFPGSVAKPASIDGISVIFHSAKISPGNSGGPLIDAFGRVCGINTAFIPAEVAGSDYPISIHSSELISLANAYSIPISTTSSKILESNSNSGIYFLLSLVFIAIVVIVLVVAFRKQRAAFAHVRNFRNSNSDQSSHRDTPKLVPPRNTTSALTRSMRLHGRSLNGRSFDVILNIADFQRSGGRLVIGRTKEASQIVLLHDSISRQHATFYLQGENVYLGDSNSANGTQVNGRKLSSSSPPVPLHSGDKIFLGEVELLFEIGRCS